MRHHEYSEHGENPYCFNLGWMLLIGPLIMAGIIIAAIMFTPKWVWMSGIAITFWMFIGVVLFGVWLDARNQKLNRRKNARVKNKNSHDR